MKLIPNEVIKTHLQRLEMAESVTFTNQFARDLLMQAMEAAPAVAQVPPLTEAQIKRHSMLAADCPSASAVILVSSLRRLLAAAPEAPAQTAQGDTPNVCPKCGSEEWDEVYERGYPPPIGRRCARCDTEWNTK